MPPLIIGGGHNALVAAFTLGRAGLKPIVFERRPQVGGGAITAEIHPGFRCPALSHDGSLFSRELFDAMALGRHGAELLTPSTLLFAPTDGGRALFLYEDAAVTAQSIARFSSKDAGSYPAFRAALDRIGAMMAGLLNSPAPDVDAPSAGALWTLLKTGRGFRSLGKRDGFRLLRWAPMPVADFVREWFECELLCAAIAGPAVSGTMFGPRSAGSAFVLLMYEAHRARGAGGMVRGGPGALTQAMSAAAAATGVEIRTGAGVARILVKHGRVVGVVLDDGSEVPGDVVLSSADPRTTFLALMDPLNLTPDVLGRAQNYRSRGTLAKVNLALSSLPTFDALRGQDANALSGRIHIGPDLDYLEQAFDHSKYGELSASPWLDVRIPSVLDRSLAPEGGHVMSIYVHNAPYELRGERWESAKPRLLHAVTRVLSEFAPDLPRLILAAHVITPQDLEREFGFSGGHPFHGELAFDQLYAMRPFLGAGAYQAPVAGLYLCGAGTHPGGFMTGLSGRFAAERVLRTLKRSARREPTANEVV